MNGRPNLAPALGRVERLPGRRIAVRAAVIIVLLAAALVVRAAGVLHPDDGQGLPPLPEVAAVLPDVWRAATPTETEMVLLRDTFAVRGLVSVGRASVEEQAVTAALGLRLLQLDVAVGAAPDAAQVTAVRDFVRAAGAPVLLHDGTGTGPVVVTAAMLQLVEGRPLDEVLAAAHPNGLTPPQARAVRDLGAALDGPPDPNNPYAAVPR